MGDPPREVLLGYLIGALEEHEQSRLKIELDRSESLRDELTVVRNELQPLENYLKYSERSFVPPPGLAQRTCRSIWDRIDSPGRGPEVRKELPGSRSPIVVQEADPFPKPDRQQQPVADSPRAETRKTLKSLPRISGDSRWAGAPSSWHLSDVFASLSVVVILAMVLFPAIQFVREQAKINYCQNVMRKIGENSAFSAQLRDYDHSTGLDDALTYTGGDIGSLLSSFSKAEFAPETLRFSYPNGPEAGELYYLLSDHADTAAAAKELSEAGIAPFVLKPETLTTTDSGRTYAQWGNAHIPVLSDSGTAHPIYTPVGLSTGQNILYRDGHVFFRRVNSK